MFTSTYCNLVYFSPLQSAYCNLSSTFLLLSTMQITMGLPLFSLATSAAYDTIDHAILNSLTTIFCIMVSSNNWLKSCRSFLDASGCASFSILPSSCGVPLSLVPAFNYLCLLQLYPSHVNQLQYAENMHCLFSSFPLHLYLAVFAPSSGVFVPFVASFFTVV